MFLFSRAIYNSPMRYACAILLVTLPVFAATNLVQNPTFEGPPANGLPAHWSALTLGSPAHLEVDPAERHANLPSVRITADEITRSYVQSDAIEVAAGETIACSAWVKYKDLPPAKGAVIIIAAFSDAGGNSPSVAKFNSITGDASHASGDWQLLQGSVPVPAASTQLRIRLGFSYCKGTVWWSNVSVTAREPLVARVDLPGSELSPALDGLPVTLLNRTGRAGSATFAASLSRELPKGKSKSKATAHPAAPVVSNVTFTAEPVQNIPLRFPIPSREEDRGRYDLTLAVSHAGGAKPFFTTERQVTIPPPLLLAPPIPTHWAAEDPNPRLDAEVSLAVPRAQLKNATLEAKLVNASSHPVATWSAHAPDPDHTISISLSPQSNLPAGDYMLSVDLKPSSGQPLHAEYPWHVIPRRMARVTLNSGGYPEYDGKAIFPIGMFNAGNDRNLEMGPAGWTITHAYNAIRINRDESPAVADARALAFMDSTQKAGMHALFLIPREQVFHGQWDLFRRRIRMFRNHPGLLAWDEEEGLARGDMKLEDLAKMVQIIREEDPNHPIMVGDSRDVITAVKDRSNFFPLAQMDMGMWWWYPFPLKAKPAGALEGDEGTSASELAPPTFLVQRNTDKPLWVGVQAYKHNNADGRYPTPVEYRAQAYIALIHGAKGLMWYGGGVQGGLSGNPTAAHWPYLKSLGTELARLGPALMSPDEAAPKFSPDKAPLSIALKHGTEHPILLTANRGADAIDVTITLPRPVRGSIQVLDENRTVTARGAELKDHFDAYAVHVYQLP